MLIPVGVCFSDEAHVWWNLLCFLFTCVWLKLFWKSFAVSASYVLFLFDSIIPIRNWETKEEKIYTTISLCCFALWKFIYLFIFFILSDVGCWFSSTPCVPVCGGLDWCAMQRSRRALLERRALDRAITGRSFFYKVSLSLVFVLWGLLFLLSLWVSHGDGYKGKCWIQSSVNNCHFVPNCYCSLSVCMCGLHGVNS